MEKVNIDGLKNLNYIFIYESGFLENYEYKRGTEESVDLKNIPAYHNEKYLHLEAVK